MKDDDVIEVVEVVGEATAAPKDVTSVEDVSATGRATARTLTSTFAGPVPKALAPHAGAIDTSFSESGTTSQLAPEPARTAAGRKKYLEKHNAFIGRLDRGLRKDATKVLIAAMKAADIDDGSPKPEGWTDREYRIARDARSGAREAPMYLSLAQKTYDGFTRAETMREQGPTTSLNFEAIQVVVNNYNYEKLEDDK